MADTRTFVVISASRVCPSDSEDDFPLAKYLNCPCEQLNIPYCDDVHWLPLETKPQKSAIEFREDIRRQRNQRYRGKNNNVLKNFQQTKQRLLRSETTDCETFIKLLHRCVIQFSDRKNY